MSLFVIAEKNRSSDDLVTPVFEIGTKQSDSAVAVFFSATQAAEYIEAAGWQDDQTTAQLEPVQALKWLERASEMGVTDVVINPDRLAQEQSVEQRTISLENAFETHANLLQSLAESVSTPRL